MSHTSHYTSTRARRVAVGLVSGIPLVLSTLHPASVHGQALPSPWTETNLGGGSPVGSATQSNGTFTVQGGGRRLQSTADEFFFVHQQVSGDVIVTARVQSIEKATQFSKAAVTIRETLDASSRHVTVTASAAQEIGFQRRVTAGAATEHTTVSGGTPVWLRVERSGSTFRASWSSSGSLWTELGTATVSMAASVYVGLAVSSHTPSSLATGMFTNVLVTRAGGASLPSGWSAADVGAPAVQGQTTWNGSDYSIRGAGGDIGGTSDQFQYLYREASGDLDIVARVASLDGPHAWSKAGVMIRPSLAANAANAYALVSTSSGIDFQYRPGSGLPSLPAGIVSGLAPVWLKIERRGSAITAFRSSTGTSWSLLGSTTLTLGSTFYVGIAVTSHDATGTAAATVTDLTVSNPSGTPPIVSLTSPAADATFVAPAAVSLAASASDADGGVDQVEFYANGVLLATDASSPYSYTWSGMPGGTYLLTAVARGTGGLVVTSAPRTVTVSGSSSNAPPAVSLTAPAPESAYAAPASVSLSASAVDSDGSVSRVDFYAGSMLVGSDTSSPYSATWSNAPAGTYALTAVARDNAGASATSATRSITINPAPMPNRAIFAPSPDHAIVTRYSLDIFTPGANPDSTAPIATVNLGKPAVVDGECTVDVSAAVSGLPGGTYFGSVVAISSSGTSPRALSTAFSR